MNRKQPNYLEALGILFVVVGLIGIIFVLWTASTQFLNPRAIEDWKTLLNTSTDVRQKDAFVDLYPYTKEMVDDLQDFALWGLTEVLGLTLLNSSRKPAK